ncbi:MAG: tetratricopeptide repeat protein [Acidobacteriota bacterium]
MLKLTCKQCSTQIEIPDDLTRTADARIVCPSCGARYRLRPRHTAAQPPAPTPAAARPVTPSAESAGAPPATPQQRASGSTVSPAPAPQAPQAPTTHAAPPTPAAAETGTPGRHHSLTPATPLPSMVPGQGGSTAVPGQGGSTAANTRTDAAGSTVAETIVDTVTGTRPLVRGPAVFADGDLVADRYRVVRFLAQGGMGEVYEVEDQALRQHLALKTISSHAGQIDPSAVERFKREITLARSVTHPNVCRIFDLGEHQPPATPEMPPAPPVTFLTMELLAGETLADCLRRRGRLKTREALPLVTQMAAALGAAHQAQVVHRDFKSENVFLVPQDPDKPAVAGRVVVTDFGVARGGEGDRFASQVTGAGIVGTPAYMAPEQVEGGPITQATDLYSLGIVIYEMVTGRLPFESANPLTTAVKRLREPPPPPHIHVPDLEAWWERAILRCLERDPARRFASTDELVAALQPPVKPAQQSPPAQPEPRLPSHPAPDPARATATGTSPSLAAAGSFSPSSEGPARPGAFSGAAAASAPSQRRSWVLGAVLILVSLLSAGLFYFNRDRELDRSRITPRRSVAVLGFKNLGENTADAWLATALAEMLTTELARGEALRTIPGETVARARQEMALDDTSGLDEGTLDRVRSLLGSDFLVHGTYLSLGDASREIRLDVRLQDAALGSQVAAVARNGNQADLFTMVADLGSELRSQLGVAEGSAGDDPLGGLPSEPEAARLYAVALDELRNSRPRAAREKLESASRLAPQNALVFSALSQAWEAEGYGQRAAEAAKRAFELSSPLPREDRLAVEGRYLEAIGDWPAAVDVYRQLSEYFPDDLEYGLRLVAAQTSQRDARAALRTIESLRRLPPPISEDPRIDLAEASAAGHESDFVRQLEAAQRAAERAQLIDANLLVAQARLAEAQAHRALGHPDDAAVAADAAYRLYSDLDHGMGAAQAMTALGNVHFDHGELDDAADRYRQVIESYRRLGDQDATASGLNNLAMVLKRRGDLDAAQALYQEAAAIFDATDDNLAMAFALNNLGVLLVARDLLSDASSMFERSRAAWEDLGNRSGLAYSLNNIAAVRHLMGDLRESRSLHDEALAIRQETGEKNGEATSLTNLAEVLCDLGELEQAEELLTQAVNITEEVGDRSAQAQALHVLGRVQLDRGELEQARSSHQQALELRRELEESRRVTDSQVELARVALEAGDAAAAERDSQQAISELQQQERPSDEARAKAVLALALLAQDRLEPSRQAAESALQLAGTSERPAVRIRAGLAAAHVQAARGNLAAALSQLAALESESRESGHSVLTLEAMLAWAQIAQRAGRNGEARQRLDTLESETAIRGLGLLASKARSL